MEMSDDAPTCETCGDERFVICNTCNGSGEGYVDGSHCLTCGGFGEVRCPACEEDD